MHHAQWLLLADCGLLHCRGEGAGRVWGGGGGLAAQLWLGGSPGRPEDPTGSCVCFLPGPYAPARPERLHSAQLHSSRCEPAAFHTLPASALAKRCSQENTHYLTPRHLVWRLCTYDWPSEHTPRPRMGFWTVSHCCRSVRSYLQGLSGCHIRQCVCQQNCLLCC